jgi:hypothetical protein
VTLEDSVNEVLRKIGRNMMLFQQLEHLLKFIVANGSFSGYVSELNFKKEQRAASIQKQTMGQLVGQYIETTNPEYQDFADEPEDLKEAFFSFKFYTECDSVYYETKKDALAQIVSDRNELVHHMLPKFDTNSIESCIQIEKQLDKQREEILCEINELRQKVDSLQEGRKILAEFLNSDEGKKQFEISWLRQSRLVLLLGDIAVQTARTDGWASINIAGQLVKQHAPEEVALLKERYGHESLKELIVATEIFDIYEEPTEKGFRVLYRLKSGWELKRST